MVAIAVNIEKRRVVFGTLYFFFVITCFLTLNSSNAKGQETFLPNKVIFRHLTETEGLLNNNVNCILQDKWGYIWIGTEKGLNRYDGSKLVAYTYNSVDTNSLSGNHITSLFEDSKGRIWIGTNKNGITVYEPTKEKFTRYNHDDNEVSSINKGYVAQIYEDTKHRIWVCLYRGGLELLNEDDNTFTHHLWDPDDVYSIAGNKVKSILELEPDIFLVGTFEAGDGITDIPNKGHINLFHYKENKFEKFEINNINIKSYYRQGVNQMARLVHTISPDDFGNIWFGTYCGALKYTPGSGVFNYYQNNEISETSISCNIVRSLCAIGDKVYFGTEGGGLSVLDTLSEKFNNYRNDPNDPNSISDDLVRAVYKDREDRIWIGTSGGGVNIIDPPKRDFVLYSNKYLKIQDDARMEESTIRALLAKSGKAYVGTYSGLSCLNTSGSEVKLFQKAKIVDDLRYKCQVYAIEESADGNLWVGFNNMLMKCDVEKGKFTYHSTPGEFLHFDRKRQEDLPIIDIAERKDGSLWVGHFGTTSYAYNPFGKCLVDKAPLLSTRLGITDSEGRIWAEKISSNRGIGLVKINQDWTIREYIHVDTDSTSISSNSISYIYCDKSGKIWLATNNGVDIYDESNEGFVHLNGIKNFPDTLISCMAEDHHGNMWFVSDFALLRMDTSRNVIVFSVNKDLPVHKLENQIAFDESDHAMYFSANEGLIKFYPDRLKLKHEISPIYISGIKLFNEPYKTDTSTIIKKKYAFNWNENFLSINFASLNYSNDFSQNYAYKLDGLNDDWVYVGNSTEANFTNLDPGVYTFQVRGSTHEGLWDLKSEPITIVIKTPWWKSSWFYTVCVALLLFSIWAYNRYRTMLFSLRTQKLENEVDKRTLQYKEQKEKAEKSERLRQDFIAKISHEIRTPINAVSGIADLLLKKEPREEQVAYLEAISNSSDVLLHILNDVLDLSKIEAGKLRFEEISFSLIDTINKVHNTLKVFAQEKGLRFNLKLGDDLPDAVIGDPYRLSQVILNLCSNALKFTDRGNITVSAIKMFEDDNLVHVRFSVSDTGIGISKEKLKDLFEDYVQAHNMRDGYYGGTGLGLAISKNLIKLMGGDIKADSEPGKGSVFEFELPFKKSDKIASDEPARESDPTVLDGLHILLADDNEYNRIVAKDTLSQKANVVIDIAVNGVQAIEMIQKNDYDLVLMDVQMPVLDGIEATRQIRELLPYPKCNTPIIALTAIVEQAEKDRCIEAGMNEILIKPVKSDRLIEAVIMLTGNKNAQGIDRNHTAENAEDVKERVLDLTYLKEFCEGDTNRIGKYVALYVEAAKGMLTIQNQTDSHPPKYVLNTMMHNFRPKAKMMGMDSTVKLTSQIEAASEPSVYSTLMMVLLDKVKQSLVELEGETYNK